MKKQDKRILIKRYIKRKARFQKITASVLTSDASIQILGEMPLWFKLPMNIRAMVLKEGVERLSCLRKRISAEAKLPMPPIRIVPFGWWNPKIGGAIYGQAKPVIVKDSIQWGVVLPVSTLVVVDDDTVLRRILCHEFAHCFWYISKIIREMKNGKWMHKDFIAETSKSQIILEQVKIDKGQLVDPTEWFGEWDAKNFLYEGGEPLHNATKKFAEYWINAELPTELPDPTFEIDGEIEMEDEVVEHIENLDRKLDLSGNN